MDCLEDQLIDHPDEATRRELATHTFDSTFQSKLKAMAEKIEHPDSEEGDANFGDDSVMSDLNYQYFITKSHLNYIHDDMGPLSDEIAEWFTYSDYDHLGGLGDLANHFNRELEEKIDDFGRELGRRKLIDQCIADLQGANIDRDSYMVTMPLKVGCYYALGEYKQPGMSKPAQVMGIVLNNQVLIELGFYKPVVYMLVGLLGSLDKNTWDKVPPIIQQNYFRSLTLVYLMVNVAITHPSAANDEFLMYLDEMDLMAAIVKVIERWKWHPSRNVRMRYLLLLVWKLMLFEFGTEHHRAKCDEFLVDLHGIKNKPGHDCPETKLVCSPLDYFSFREDLVDKFPMFAKKPREDNPEEIPEETYGNYENQTDTLMLLAVNGLLPSHLTEENYQFFMAVNSLSNSLSNLIEVPKTTKSHTVLSQLPTQTVHIATPVPSPVLAALDYMTGGEKIRRLYQVNQAMPFIFPTELELVPLAIEQADELFRLSIYDLYSNKRLWNERTKFMKQERGYAVPVTEDEFEYPSLDLASKHPQNASEVRAILRVEKFYRTCFVQLHTFTQVLVEVIKLNKLDFNFTQAEWELDPQTLFFKQAEADHLENKDQMKRAIDFVLLAQLEVVNVKEITLKASLAIILLMLRWFKINHVLKFHYLLSILFDQQVFAISLDYVSKGFNNANLQEEATHATNELLEYETIINQNKIMNPGVHIPQFDLFNNCLDTIPDLGAIPLINKTKILSLPKIADANNVNNVYLPHFNRNYCFILSNLLTINNKMLPKNQTQRIFTMNDLKPLELYKMILINYDCPAFTMPILKTLKKLVPYQGRKWKLSNMDLISQIYLKLRLQLKDNWLSGKDLETDFNNLYDQEIALRALLQFYNISRYPSQMEQIGYHLEKDLDIPGLWLDDE